MPKHKNTPENAQEESHFTQKMPFWRGVRYAIETVFAYLIYGFFWIFPVDIASAIGGFLGRHIGPRLGITKKAYNNLSLAFPEKTMLEKTDIILAMWDNLGRTISEYPHLKTIAKRTEMVDAHILEKARDDKKAAIVVSGHLANWEVFAAAPKQNSALQTHVAYRKPNNPWVDGLLRRARSAGAHAHIPKSRKGALEMARTIKNNKILGILVDQKFNEGIAVPFFGHDAMTMPFPAQLALKYNCPIHIGRAERLKGAHFRFTILPALEIKKTGDKEQDVLTIMTDIHTQLENWITEHPAQWLWLHQRWPKQPTTFAVQL